MQRGLLSLNGKTYYLGMDGAVRVEFHDVGNEPYHFEADGCGTVKGFFKCGSKKYYSVGDGKLAVGVKYIDGNTYEFDQHGVLLQ